MYMQFMEPIGATDPGFESAWEHLADRWRPDLVETIEDLAPDVIRWGGIYSRHYKWREGVGPPELRPSTVNYYWGGMDSNRIGTVEIAELCSRVGAEQLMCVNFLSDGHERFAHTETGEYRVGDAREAADWVSYANDPDDSERRADGIEEPLDIPLWQLGNESSYGDEGFDRDELIRHTIEFAEKMRERDPSIDLIGWGDNDLQEGEFWAPTVLERAGEHLDLVAMHMMGMEPVRENTVLDGFEYQRNPEQAWDEMLELAQIAENRLGRFREAVRSYDHGIAVTEGHLSIDPYNANPILQEWLSAVYHAKTMNAYLRNGDRVKICTGADFFGPRWTVNAVRMPEPGGDCFLLPIGSIMGLYNRHRGTHGADVEVGPPELDVAASVGEDAAYLHVLNTSYDRAVEVGFEVGASRIEEGTVREIAPSDPRAYVDVNRPDTFVPETRRFEGSWSFPARSVSVVELPLEH